MAAPVAALEGTHANFAELVLGNSRKGLVLVHFWTPKAGPCLLLQPRLQQLAADYRGRFLLVQVNTDEQGRIARAEGVTSVPTVRFYRDGEVVHTVHGAESEASFRVALGRFLASEADSLRLEAMRRHQAGDSEAAIQLLARAATERPEDLDISLDLAKILVLSGQGPQALRLLAALPGDARRDGRIAPLLAHLELIDSAENGPPDVEARLAADPADAEARLALAARALVADRHEAALEALLALTLAAPGYRDDIGRRALLGVFALLGPEHALTRRYRARLAAAH
jgi:putative thioredoxin